MERSQNDDVGVARKRKLTFTGLPDRIKYEDMVIEVPATYAQDPEMGRDTDRDFMFRNLG